jgi:iron complex outermembrane receptor protein
MCVKKSLIIFLLLPVFGYAAEQTLDPVVVTATRYGSYNLETPAAIDKYEVPSIGLKFTPADILSRVPGMQVVDTTGTDIKLVTRGFSAKSAFASRGVQIWRDGIPVTTADAVSQTSLIDMNTIGDVEVMRGPFSSLYGPSSSTIVHMFTEIPTKNEISYGILGGNFNTKQENIKYAGVSNNVKYLINQSQLTTDGYRDFSHFNRDQTTAKLWVDSSEYTNIQIGANLYKQSGQDYGNGNGGITLSQLQTNPYGVDPSVYNINSWKNVDQNDMNVKTTHAITPDNILVVSAYAGNRNQEQLSPTSESNTVARTTAGLLKNAKEFWGTEARIDHSGTIGTRKYDLTFGVASQTQNEFVTNGKWMTLGVQSDGSTLTRSVKQQADSLSEYVQGRLALTEKTDLHVGVRNVDMTMEFIDQLTAAANGGDNGGKVNYNGLLPTVGLVWKLQPKTSLYASFAKGMELPTFVETQFSTAVATTKPNTTLKPSKSDNYEAGIKSYIADSNYITAALFQAKTQDEIVITTNVPGYKVFGNLGSTTRQGVEISLDSKLPYGFGVYTAMSYLTAVFDDTGKTIPGVSNTTSFTEFSWKNKPENFKVAVEAIHSSKMYGEVDNSVESDGYTIYNLKVTAKQKVNKLTFTEYVAVNNLENKVYVANLRTAAQYGRYYESGVARNTVIGVNASYAF